METLGRVTIALAGFNAPRPAGSHWWSRVGVQQPGI